MSQIILSLFIVITLRTPLIAQHSRSHSASTHSYTRTPASLGHTPYSRSGSTHAAPLGGSSSTYHGSATRTGTRATVTTGNRAYRPGITHSNAISDVEKTNAYMEAHKAAEKRKAEEAKKKAAQPEIHSVNRLISPPKPKTVKPAGPFGGK